ncbi:ATP-binding protein [Streptomyces sp. NPDC054849]
MTAVSPETSICGLELRCWVRSKRPRPPEAPAGDEVATHTSALHSLPQARFAAPDAESGRGLLLVDSLAKSWGTVPTAEGKAVWFSLPLPSPRR